MGVLQISYRYKSRDEELRDIQKSIAANPVVKDVKAFTLGEEGFIHDMIQNILEEGYIIYTY